jgi:hypothetical protein
MPLEQINGDLFSKFATIALFEQKLRNQGNLPRRFGKQMYKKDVATHHL